ncbi:MAG TPA: stage II sporulation protein E [Epulopiscium sp.]|nr:stage II sporulation protein E [Candidatus Epulonipiscium sp.]
MNKILEYTYEKLVSKRVFSSIRWNELAICLIGFMIGRINILSGWNPLSVAYVGATHQTKNLQKWNGIFTILGILSVTQSLSLTIKYITAILLILLVRWYMEGMHYKVRLGGQVAITIGATFVISIIIIAVRGFTWYDFAQTILELIFIFAFVFIYHKGTELILENKKNQLTNQQVIGATVLLVSMIGGMVELYIEFSKGNRIYIRDIMCFFIIISISYLGETSVGAAMGTVIGTLLVMIGYIPPHLISIYALAGLGGGLLAPLGKLGAVLGVLSGHMIGIYFINDAVIDLSLLGAYFIGVMIFLICPKNFFGFSNWFGNKEREYEQEVHMDRIQKLTTIKLESFAEAFKKLSNTFGAMSVKKTSLTQKDISRLFEDVTDKVCTGCGLADYCWNKDFYNTYQSAYGILAAAEQKDKITPADVPEEFKKKCIRLENFVHTLDQTFELYKQNLMWQNRIVESRELVSEQLGAVASIIKKLSNEIEQQVVFKRDMEKQVKEELAAKGIKIKDALIILTANEKYEVTIITDRKIDYANGKNTIISILNNVIGRIFEVEQHNYGNNQDEVTTKFKEVYKYRVVAATSNIAKVGSVSGDQYSVMEISNGQYLLAISDGMGSGLSAYNESTATIELLEEFIGAGFEKDMAIRLINSVLILKSSEEVFSTMDMAIVDMHSGITEFIKIGAATTFVKKKNYVEILGSNSLPAGILSKVDIETQKRQLRDGDMIIMVSDGILDIEKDKFNQENTFIRLIEEVDTNNPQYMADSLLEKAKDLICGEIDDDMTIIVARIWEKPYKN